MIFHDNYNNTVKLGLLINQPVMVNHSAQYFRPGHLRSALDVPVVGDETLRLEASWMDRLFRFTEDLDHEGSTTEMAREAREISREFDRLFGTYNCSQGQLLTKSFARLTDLYGLGFSTLFMTDFYCMRCDATEFIGALMVNSGHVVNGSGATVQLLRNYYNHGNITTTSVETRSCPYCSPAEFELGAWKRLLYRKPDCCTCDACGR